MIGRALFAFAVAAVALLTTARGAASPSARLVYIRSAGAETCPGEAELRKAVAVRIGYDPFFPSAQKTVVAQVERGQRGFRGRIQIVGDDGNVRGARDLGTTGDDCTELAFAMALAVSIALDDLDEPEPEPRPEPEKKEALPEPAVERAPPPVAAREAPLPWPPRPRSPGPTLALSIGPSVSMGTAPDAAAGAGLAASIRFKRFAARLDLRGELPSSGSIAPTGQIATNIAVATAAACLRGEVPFVCMGGGGGIVASKTRGLVHSATDSAPVFALVARAGAAVPLAGRTYLEPSLEVGANMAPHRVEVDGLTVHRASPVWGALAIQVGIELL